VLDIVPLVNAQTTITAFVPVAGGNALPTPAGVQGTDQFAPIGILSNGKVVFTDHAVATVPGAGVGNFDGKFHIALRKFLFTNSAWLV
jgi:hypothetical protein